ncbi:DUF896 domain-containing protein [Alkalicella caledoniensis]|uniref:UPF0291 protein HYG86_16415 n=1 Tax=Alkalicella caledoniensis TaxID=2731377 RepID=A0A7G9WC29_ALKCA|nr:DUF896 domain-containing protein [Alkalicella caledoniensis]QNO16241.1 DUF896 domain-containing protein [Alkalicella caledoniensis]
MLTKDKIDRINYLARKKKEQGLTPGEEREQHSLRQEYLGAVRGQVRSTLDRTKFVNEEGNEILVKHSYKHKNCGCGCNGHSQNKNHTHHDDCGCDHVH